MCKGERTTQPTCNLYIIRRGLLGSEGRVYRANHILGEDIVCENFERTYNINALTFVSTLTLSSIHLHEILESDCFEYQRRKIRRRSVMISVRARLHSLARVHCVALPCDVAADLAEILLFDCVHLLMHVLRSDGSYRQQRGAGVQCSADSIHARSVRSGNWQSNHRL